MATVILIIDVEGIGFLPALISDAGSIMSDVFAWMVAKKRQHAAGRTLFNHAVGLSHFADYWTLNENNCGAADIFTGCFEALVHGCPALGWRGVETETAMKQLESVNQFIDWFSDQKEVENPNPKKSQPLSWGGRLKEYRRRAKTDMLAHLASATNSGGVTSQRRKVTFGKARRSTAPEPSRPNNRFEFSDFNKLIAHESNPRNQVLWLCLGAAGLRVSEPMHLFVNDILYDTAANEARIRLCDPIYGPVAAMGPDGVERRYTRLQYLKEKYNMAPRDELSIQGTAQAGWKGMRLHDGKEMVAEVFWLHPFFGELLWKAHLEYLAIRASINPSHPWYFINLKSNVGAPMSISTARSVLKRRCERLNIRPAQQPHKLRHMYVDMICNELGIPIHDAQVLVRHRSSESTELYARASFEARKRALSLFMNKLPQPAASNFIKTDS
jgi:integrase